MKPSRNTSSKHCHPFPGFLHFFNTIMKVLLSGSSGLIGSALAAGLRRDGHTVVPLPRTYEQPVIFSGADAVIHLAGENIAGRWNAARKQRIEQSRVLETRRLSEQLAQSIEKPAVFICASAIGYYGSRGDELLAEESPPGNGFLADVCRRWEAAAAPAEEAGIRTVRIRTGIVLSREGGALARMLPPFLAGIGGKLGGGQQFMSWISLADEINAIRFLIGCEAIHGAVNLTAPNPETNTDFSKALGRALHRPAVLPMPALAVRLLFGEMGNELLLGGARVLPKKLIDAGYEFRHPHLESALEDILQ